MTRTAPKTTAELLSECRATIAHHVPHVTIEPLKAEDESLNVTLGYLEALVITPVNDQRGISFELVATAWDQSGGVEAEHWVADVRLEQLAVVVSAFCRQDQERW